MDSETSGSPGSGAVGREDLCACAGDAKGELARAAGLTEDYSRVIGRGELVPFGATGPLFSYPPARRQSGDMIS